MKIPLPTSIKGLVALIVLLALLPALGLIVFSARSSLKTDMEALSRDALRSARAIMAQQAQAAQSTRILLATLARLKEVKGRDAPGCAALFRNMLRQTPLYANIRLLDDSGATIVAADPEGARLSGLALEEFEKAQDVSGFSVYALPRESGKDTPLINCLYPVQERGAPPGVLMASLKIMIAPAELNALSVQHIEYLHIVDKNGRIVFGYPQENLEGGFEEHRNERDWQRIKAAPEARGYFVEPGGQYVVFDKLIGREGAAPDLTLVLNVSANALYERMRGRIAKHIFLLSSALFVALLVALQLCSATLLSPLKALLEAANRIKEGDLTSRTDDASMPQELRLLASSIDGMANNLAARDKELTAARDVATSAGQAKTDFLANMSHEIRTPMNAILGMTYLARQQKLTEQQRAYLESIHSEADKLLLIINDILDFSKIEAGRFHIEQITFAVHPLLEEVIAEATEEAARKGIDFAATLPSDLPRHLKGDPFHLKQVLANVLSGAVKVTETGRLGLLCLFEAGVPPALELEFRVTDSGGMKVEELARLFPDEDNVSGALDAGPGGGFVLNLAVTRKLARLMQGSLQIKTVPHGVGNSIMLRMPFLLASAAELPAEASAAKAALKAVEISGKPLENIRIFLAEDNPVNQQIAQEILAGFGAEVHTASNGVEVLALLETIPPTQACHLILMDLQMPKMDGLEATRRIRQDKRFASLPIIAMTAQTQEEEWQQCAEVGMDDFIAKPIDVPALLATVQKWYSAVTQSV